MWRRALCTLEGATIDPSLGKWLTQDPLGIKAGPNLYAYVLNNPMVLFDMYGLEAIEIERMNHLSGRSTEDSSGMDHTVDSRDDFAKNESPKEILPSFRKSFFAKSRWTDVGDTKITGITIIAVNGVGNS